MAMSLIMRVVDGDAKRRVQGQGDGVSSSTPSCAKSKTTNASTNDTTIPCPHSLVLKHPAAKRGTSRALKSSNAL